MTDPYDDPEFRKFVREVKKSLIPKMERSSVVMSLVPEGESDVKFAVELGLSIMMDKPIIAIVIPGVKVSAKLIKVADEIVELVGGEDWHTDQRNQQAIKEAMDRAAARTNE